MSEDIYDRALNYLAELYAEQYGCDVTIIGKDAKT